MDFNGILAPIIILALTVGLVLRQLAKWRDSESTSRTDDASREENKRLKRGSVSTSRTDHGSGEENEASNSLGIEHKGSDTTDQMKRKRSSGAIVYQYDVFLSFCGGDTRLTFADYLYNRMEDFGIHVFLDSDKLEHGKRIQEVLTAVDESQIYIPIFSKKFASRSWCLREVARMFECHSKSDGKRTIIPIFYDVEPNDVKLISDLYQNDMLEHEKKEYRNREELEQWRKALKEVGSMMGFELKGKRHGQQIKSIIDKVLCKLSGKHVYLPAHLVEDHLQIKKIIEKLDVNFDGVRFLWMHGIGGIGKTTLAKVVFKKLSSHFECVSFLNDIRESSQHSPDGLVKLQEKLLSRVGSPLRTNQIQDIADGMYRIEAACKTKKVLLVLDDLNKEEQLESLAGKSDWFGSGSRIIITTRNNNILKTPGESSSEVVLNQTKEIVAYGVCTMEFGQALQLFCRCAFRMDSPIEGYAALSENLVCKVDRLPLAIVVIGSFLFYARGDKRKIWEQTIDKLGQGPFKDVRDALMISYDGLDDEQKEVFLDIACFFANEDQTYPIIMWDDYQYYPDITIDVLLERSLIKIGDDNKFWMHDQIRDLGRYIILKEYPRKENPRKFSRVWTQEDAVELLKSEKENSDVKALSLTSYGCSHNFAPKDLAALPNLRFLRVKNSDFSGNFKNILLDLRWLSWQTQQTTFHANNFHFSKLVVLDLSNSNIGDGWDGWSQMKMDRLRVLDLTGCMRLKKTPDFSNFISLEKLILAQCIELTAIDRSINKLKHLITLNIKGCRLLRELPEEVGALQSLTEVIMPQTCQPFNLPETFGNLNSLSSLILDEHLEISRLPSNIGGLVQVTHLCLRRCVGIEKLPRSLGKMEMLVELDLSMSRIVELPNSIEDLKKLKVIRVSYTMIRKFPRTIGQVEMLEELHAKKCWDLTDENLEEIGKLSHLKILDLSYTHVSRFPTVLGCLQTLELGSSDLQEVPELPSSLTRLHIQARQFPSIPNLSSLINLDYLEVSRLIVSREEPNPSWTKNLPVKELIHSLPCGLSTLKCRGIRLLPPPSDLRNLSVLCVIEYPMPYFPIDQELTNLTELKLSKCKFIEKIYDLSLLKNLRRLDLNRLDRLVHIQGLSKLESLLYFRIYDCYKIERLPNLSKLDKLQHIEVEACPKLKAIEGIKGLESLVLDNHGCTILERLQDVSRSTWLSRKVPECQVFLSFSGLDASYCMVDILYNNLVRHQISVFRDNDILSSGDGIGEKLPRALNNCHIYIPFLSKSYASSCWCLRELAHMVKCTSNSNGKKLILPIFYDVKVDDVKVETTLYRSALEKHKRKFGNKVKKWEMALRKVADMRGFNLNTNSHGRLIEWVIEEVLGEFRGKRRLPQHLVEDHYQIKAIIEKLDVDSGGVRFVGIHGMGGIGKTTLAKIVLDRLLLQFDSVSFLENIQESCQHIDGLVKLQKELLSSVLGSRDTIQIKDISDGMDQIKRICSTKKVLIVLDNLDKNEQLEKLAGKSNWFGLGSRIIITTRDKSILMTQEESSNAVALNQPSILAYEVHEMESGQALQLFHKHASGGDSPLEEYDFLAKEIIYKVGMLPLAIEAIGSSLYCQSIALGQRMDKIKLCEDRLKEVDRGPSKVVRDSLMISYQGLKNVQKEVFLDIACFFTNEDKTHPVTMWNDYYYHFDNAIDVLLQRSLIKIKDNKFCMHNQLRDLGRHIILEEYSCKFSRVWIQADAAKLLMTNESNQDVEALNLTSSDWSGDLTANVLAVLPKLRFLRVKGLNFSGDFKNFHSELRWLSWQIEQMSFHVENFHFSRLVVLDLSDSNIKDGWVGWSQMKMNKLKVLDLTDCKQLQGTPDFSNFTSLERLILSWCVKLTTIHSSIGMLKCLETLSIDGCSSLGELPAEIGSLESLTEIIIPHTTHPFKLPETFGDLQALSSLILDEHPNINQLPNSIGGLVKVTHLSLRLCVGIQKLPCSIGKMKMLEELDLSKSGIVELPDSIGCLKKLKVIRVSYTMIRKFPCTIAQVEMLEELHAKNCWNLTDENLEEIGKLSHLRILDLLYSKVSKFPTVQGCLSCLRTLEMSSSHLLEVRHLPPSLTHLHLRAHHFPSTFHFTSLVSLDYLELSRLTASIEEPSPTWTSDLPEEQPIHPLPSDLSTLKFRGISPLPPLSNLGRLSVLCVIECPLSGFSVCENLVHLKELKLSKCKFLEKILGLSLLKNLEHLDLNRLESLVEIDGLLELESLLYFRISHCGRIERLPNLSKLDKLGHIELEACPKIRAIEGLESLELDNCGCTILKRLVDVLRSTWLSHKGSKNQVFLSFNEPDTSHSIVNSLCRNLFENQILAFWHDKKKKEPSSSDEPGEELSLDNSDIYIPFLSKNYASSGSCLRELAHMVECTSKSNGGKKILPIFYNVEIDDVKLESDLYKSALAKHRTKFGDEVEQWEKALREVAGMRGLDPKTMRLGPLTDFASKWDNFLFNGVLYKLNAKKVDVPEYLVEDHEHVEALIKLLDVDSSGVRFVGIHGTRGIGKTTIAKVVFNKLFSHFDAVSFLNDVRESWQHGLINLQRKLLSSFVGSVIADQIEDNKDVMNQIKKVYETRKILLVLDDLDEENQLKGLAGKSDWFGSGSRIIITTRDKNLLQTSVESSSEEDQKQTKGILTYKLNQSDEDRALQLFCNHAFKRDSPMEGYDHLTKQIVDKVGGHHVVVEVIGSYLYYHGCDLEPHGDKKRLWEDTLMQLNKCDPNDILHFLMVSFAGLENNSKEIFLDIACFFINEDQTYPAIMWDECNDHHSHSAIRVLLQLSLVKIKDNKFWMPSVLRDLGMHIIERVHPHIPSRVRSFEEVQKLRQRNEGNKDVKALSLTSFKWIPPYELENLDALPNLRFLRVKGCEFVGNFENPHSKLIWLSWQPREKTFYAKNFHFSNLIVLDLSYSDVGYHWDGWSQMKMERLKVLDLTGCKRLQRTPNFSNFMTLEMLILARCVKLTTIDSSIGKLTLLRTLNLEGCRSLVELPKEVGFLHSLMLIVMPQPNSYWEGIANAQYLPLKGLSRESLSPSSLMCLIGPTFTQKFNPMNYGSTSTHEGEFDLEGCCGPYESKEIVRRRFLTAELGWLSELGLLPRNMLFW